MAVEEDTLPLLFDSLLSSAAYAPRRAATVAFNRANKFKKRGIAVTAVKYGIAFTPALCLNRASALVLCYTDGSVRISHGGVEMGQGLHTKMRQVAAHALGVGFDKVFGGGGGGGNLGRLTSRKWRRTRWRILPRRRGLLAPT